MINIKVIVRSDKKKKNGDFPLYYLVRGNGFVLKVPARMEIKEENWDPSVRRLKRNTPNSVSTNALLDKKEQEFKDFVNNNLILGLPISKTLVKNFLKGVNQFSLNNFFEEVMLTKQVCESTRQSYLSTLRILKQFKREILFQEINLLLVKEFNHYLIHKRKNSSNGAGNRHKHFKYVIGQAIKNDLMQKNPYDHFKIPKTNTSKGFLTIEEVSKIQKLTFSPKDQHLEKHKDLFLFSCFTGLRFSDVLAISSSNLHDGFLNYVMKKTRKHHSILLIAPAKAIIEKYAGRFEGLFPKVSNTSANKALKKIIKMAEIQTPVTFHLGRHSFASILVNFDVPMRVLQGLLAHSNLKQTETYAKVKDSKASDAIRMLEHEYENVMNQAS